MVTPLGCGPDAVLQAIRDGRSAAAPPSHFDASVFACPVCAQVKDFQPLQFLSEPKMLRLMNRDAQFAVAAARLALKDSGVSIGQHYAPSQVALFGATGMAGLSLNEVAPLLKASLGESGSLDLSRFGQHGLKAISPLLSFKILSNMPVCFVSICENIQGPNAIYTPWEGQGAQAIEAGVRAILVGRARCALVGGADSKAHELAFIALQQQGVFRSWTQTRAGSAPAEGAVFLVLEDESAAAARGARIYARLTHCAFQSCRDSVPRKDTMTQVLRQLPSMAFDAFVSASDGDEPSRADEANALASANIKAQPAICPKSRLGNLFAAAAPAQVALGALLVYQRGRSQRPSGGTLRTSQSDLPFRSTLNSQLSTSPGPVLANCFGHGSELAAFVLEPASHE